MYDKKKTKPKQKPQIKTPNKQKSKQNNTKLAQFLTYVWFSILNSSCLALPATRTGKPVELHNERDVRCRTNNPAQIMK